MMQIKKNKMRIKLKMQQKKQMKLLLYKRNVHFYHVIILYCTYEYLCIILQNGIYSSLFIRKLRSSVKKIYREQQIKHTRLICFFQKIKVTHDFLHVYQVFVLQFNFLNKHKRFYTKQIKQREI